MNIALSDPTSVLRHVADRLAIQELVHSYNHALDGADQKLFERLWTPDSVWQFPEETGAQGLGKLEGIDTIMAAFRRVMASRPEMNHVSSNLVVEINGDRAQGRSKSFTSGRGRPSLASYDDVYVRVAGDWKILSRKVTPHLHG